jgi:uncharacterized protein HemX/uroporphyrinogen-III synthase
MSKPAQSVFAGRRVIVTRPIDQAAGLMTALADLGAEPIALPLLRIESVMAPEALAAEFESQSAADVWIFTSVNAVAPLRALPAPIAWPPRVIAIGQATAAALAAMGVNAWSPASGSRSEDLLADPRLGDVGGLTVTLVGGEGGRSLLADTLRERGATVNVAAVYRRVAEAPTAAQLATALERADVVHFTSAEAMSAYHAAMQAADRPSEGAGAPRWLVISPRLVDHAKSLGYSDAPLLAAGPYDADLIAALHSHFGAVSSMSDPSSKSAEPVSVPAAPKPPAASPKPPAPPPRVKSGGRGAGVAIFFALVAILISAGGVAAGYWAWMQLDTSRALLIKDSEQTQRVAEDVARQQNAAMDIAQQVGDQAAALQLRMEGYDEAVGQLKDRIDLGSSQITLTTVEQLLLLANERLQLAGDIKGADTALNRADDRLARLADPRLHGVREAISRERAALAALPRFDREGVALALSSLIEQLDNLPLAPNVREAPEMDLSDVDMDGERPVLDRLGDILRQLFVLRREGGENIGALPESAAATTVLLLHVKLENARAAWLAGDVTNFVRILTSAQQWLARHFAVDQPAVSAFEAEIQRLQRQPDMRELPDLTRSLTLMRAQLEPGAQ